MDTHSCTADGGTGPNMRIFINGGENAIGTRTETLLNADRDEFYIGGQVTSGASNFRGKMFDIFTFSSAFNSSEIKDLMNKGPFSQTYKKYETNLVSPKEQKINTSVRNLAENLEFIRRIMLMCVWPGNHTPTKKPQINNFIQYHI